MAALTSAALMKQPADTPTPEGTGGGSRAWQREVWDYYDLCGELHYASTFMGNCMSRIRLTVALPDEDGTPGPVFDEDGNPLHPDAADALLLLRELESRIAGTSQVMRAMGLNSFVAGEFYLLGTEVDAGPRTWEVLSVDELRPKQLKAAGGKTTYERVEAPGATPQDIPPDAVVLRIWTPHPRWSYLADSSIRALRDVLEEIILMTREIRGQVMSRLAAAGLLVVPAEIDYPDDENASEDSDEGDPFTRDLIRTMSTAIADKATAAAVVPFVLRAPYDYSDRIRHIDFARPRDIESSEKRKETVQRFAQGVDLPVEVVVGHAQTTFCVDDETEALTEAGWRRRADLAVGDQVLTLDHRTGLARWEPIQAMNVFEVVDEPMLAIDTKAHSSLTTAGHRWPVLLNDTRARRWRTSGGRSHERLNRNSRVVTAAAGGAASEPKWSDDFVELVAWHYTEGHISHGGVGIISQALDRNPEKCDRIRGLLHHLAGLPVPNLRGARGQQRAWCERVDANRPMARFVLSRPLVSDLEVVAPAKIPTAGFIRSLTAAQLELFLHVSHLADGWVTNTGTVLFAQRDPAAVDAYEMAAILSGRTTSRWSRALGSGPYAATVMHYCSITDRTTVRPFNSPLTGPGHRREWTTYTGKVWCPTTATGTWLARRHGRVFYTGNSNAWQIDEALFKTHVEPKVQTLVDALTIGYLRPLMPGTPLIVYYDPSELVSHPDRSAVAQAAYDRIELSGSSYRDAIGFSDSDKPDDDEITRRIEWARVMKTPDLSAPGAPVPATSPGGNGAAPGAGPTTSGAVAAAAEVSILRAVQRAGARLRSKANGSEIGQLLRGIPDIEVGATLGPDRCGRLASTLDLFRGEFAALGAWATREVGPVEAALLVAWAEQEAADRLYAPRLSRA